MAPEQISTQPISHTRFCPTPLCIVTNVSVPFAKSGLCGRLPVFPLPFGKARFENVVEGHTGSPFVYVF